ncbi:hypothetical protein ACROYT_G023497 [Oculina patagonica]
MARRTTNRKHQGNVLKQAWEWADHTEPENITSENIESVYRINASVCSQGDCRRNCKANPNCFNCLGERFWLGEIKDDYWLHCEDPEKERRPENAFVGLKNLGATCYVNTFLQVWFHNPVFRSAMYKYISPTIPGHQPKQEDTSNKSLNGVPTAEIGTNSTDSPKMTNNKSQDDQGLNKPSAVAVTPEKASAVQQVPLLPSTTVLSSEEAPTTVCGHLQLLFAQLQYSIRRYIDPSPFVDSLGLDTAQQQDAQEFSKLFTSLLEETFSQQAEPEIQDIVQSQFGGEYFYVTECHSCGNKSKRLSRFYELDLNIQGHTSLNQCIKEFLKEEKLDGDNQYYCTQCNSKQNAARYIELHSLPPVLNLQLLRFVFDRKTGYKKKLNSFIQFPDILDMKDHVKNGCIGSDSVYELSAVLIHFGVSAYSGHYVAHIRDKKSGSWYKFNDEDIVKMQGKLKLSQDEDSADTSIKPAKRPKCAKGYHVSKNAYTLVYTLQGHKGVGSEDDDVEVPPHVQELVAIDNSRFEHWVTEVKAFREMLVALGRARQAEIKKLYQDMSVTSETEYEWISTKWLKDWMNEKIQTPPVDNSSLLCSHGKLNPNQVLNAKRINIKAADEIFRNYGGLPRLQSDSMCVNCVKEQCRRMRFESRLAEDYKFVSDALKSQTSNSEKYFWVGRRSLLRWKALANYYEEMRQSLMDSCQVTANHDVEDEDDANASRNENNDVSMTEEENATEQVDKNVQENGAEEDENDSDSKFNEDLLCEHGDLSSDESCRRLVPDVVWKRLKYYFPSSPEFAASHAVCRSCQAEDEEERQKTETYKLLATEQRAAVSQLYLDRNRPSFDNSDPFVACAISKDFLDQWRQFLRYPVKNVPPKSIINAPLLCPHEKFLFNPECEDDMDGASQELCYVWQHEWNTLTQSYPYDHVISVTKNVTEDDVRELVTSPEVCTECCFARIQERAQHVENYRYGTIFVRKITKDHSEKDIQQVLNDSTSSKDGDSYSFDPDFQTPPDSKKPKLNRDSRARRSSRHRKQRGEVSLTVGSTETLRDVKLQLMKSFSVMPMDQHLTLNGVTLSNNEATLLSLGIKPGSLLLLQIDEPQGAISQDALPVSNAPEEGFKGTGLLGHS